MFIDLAARKLTLTTWIICSHYAILHPGQLPSIRPLPAKRTFMKDINCPNDLKLHELFPEVQSID